MSKARFLAIDASGHERQRTDSMTKRIVQTLSYSKWPWLYSYILLVVLKLYRSASAEWVGRNPQVG